jgi:Kdo2-lipid IVA lauroyltransferase/acyltransferase
MPEPDPSTEELPRKKRWERAAGRFGLRLVVTPLRLMPWGMAQAAGRVIGSVLYTLLGRYRRVALKNLALVYGKETTEAERIRMAKAVFRHFGQVATEFVKLPQLDRADVDRIVAVEGAENIEKALAFGKGVLVITGHFGNWEMMGKWLTAHDYKLNVVARRANDPEADRLLRGTREGNGFQVFLRNEMIAILPDQSAVDVFVPFFGLLTGTADGPAIIHLKTGAAILFTWCIRLPDNTYRLIWEEPLVFTPTGDKKADAEAVTTLINAHLETQIRQHPTQWLWLHDRWKASPGVFADGAENARIMQMKPNDYRRERQTQQVPPTSSPERKP